MSPALVALTLIAFAGTGVVLLAGGFALRSLRRWDWASGSELQVRLEPQTYLISTLLGFALGAEALSLLLFVHTAESLSLQFVGAMCATGVLNVSAFGFPTLLLKMAVFFLVALWLPLNRIDNRGYDYPLVRLKYGLLLAITPLVLAELATQTLYFLNLQPDVITSCCGSLFGADGRGAAAKLAGLPPEPTLVAFYGTGAVLLVLGLAFRRRLPLGPLFAAACALAFGVAIAATIAVISLYVYENPNHHCPFCLLKAGYDDLGYALYAPLFVATATGLGAGAIAPLRDIESLRAAVPGEVRRLTWLALGGFGIFYGLSTWVIVRSNLALLG